VRALLERLRDIALISVDLRDLDRQALLYAAQVEEGLSDRPDVAGLVEALESVDEGEISGEDIAREIEQFLRSDGADPEAD
jgi:hypothetical protein